MAADEQKNNHDPQGDNSQDTDSVLNKDQPNGDLKIMDKKQGSFGYKMGSKQHKSTQQLYTSERDLMFSKKDKNHKGPSPTKTSKQEIMDVQNGQPTE